MENGFYEGQLVVSTQGYDKGKFYVVKELLNGYAFVINGLKRHFTNPKKKNVKHLKPLGLGCQLNANATAQTNSEVNKLIKFFEKTLKKL